MYPLSLASTACTPCNELQRCFPLAVHGLSVCADTSNRVDQWYMHDTTPHPLLTWLPMLIMSSHSHRSFARQVGTAPDANMLDSKGATKPQHQQQRRSNAPATAHVASRNTHADVLAQLRQQDEPLTVEGT